MKFYILYWMLDRGDLDFICMCEDKESLRKRVDKCAADMYLYIQVVSKNDMGYYEETSSHGFEYRDCDLSGIWEK